MEGHKTSLCSFIKPFCIYTTGDDFNQLVGHNYPPSLSYWLYTTHELNRGDTITIMLCTAMYMKNTLDFVGFSLYRKKTYGFYLLLDKICNDAQIAEVWITNCLLCFMRWLSFIQRLTIQRLCSQHDSPFNNSTTKMFHLINDAISIAKLIT